MNEKDELEQKRRKLSTKIEKLNSDKSKLDKELKKIEKEQKDKKEAKEKKFRNKIEKIYWDVVHGNIEEEYLDSSYNDDYWYDEGSDQEMVRELTEEKTCIDYNWEQTIDEAIKLAIWESKRAIQHLEGLKKFKKEIEKIEKEQSNKGK